MREIGAIRAAYKRCKQFNNEHVDGRYEDKDRPQPADTLDQSRSS